MQNVKSRSAINFISGFPEIKLMEGGGLNFLFLDFVNEKLEKKLEKYGDWPLKFRGLTNWGSNV